MDEKFVNRGFGALPPEGWDWLVPGKTTVFEINFVGDAERILAESKLSSETAQRLRDWVERVKAGEPLSVDHFLTEQEIVTRCV